MKRPIKSTGAIPELVYDLRQPNGSSGLFYADAAAFSDRLLDEIDRHAGTTVRAYARHVQSQRNEQLRSPAEYSIDLLTLGLALACYGGAAETTPPVVVALARTLFRLRHNWPFLKPIADLLRSSLTRLYLVPRIGSDPAPGPLSPGRLSCLIAWLRATGEFEQEAARLDIWQGFLCTLSGDEAAHILESAVSLFHWFETAADQALGRYTRGVPAFLAGPYARRGCREDQIFCARHPVEYHLGMVAAEVMNRGLRGEFERRPRRAVLVPTCMRGVKAADCRARIAGLDMVCTACDPDCSVNQITRRMRSLGAKVYLIPHSTGFSRWLKRWQRMPDFGVVAVACMLNILPGGYEMRARGIASQCVPLDYPGCRKHWSEKGIPTSLNQDRLAQLVQIQPHPAGPSTPAL
jgi:hypothetical protein